MARIWKETQYSEAQQLAAELSTLYPDVDPRLLPFTSLRDSLLNLSDRAQGMDPVREHLVENIRTAWREGVGGEDEEERSLPAG
ncbi:MAG: Fe-S cluster assembly protein IscX [Deltaproteobacteria bacterium]|nr:Fe-S cluster assembly protein IscX [Deltaproteobacteria bacterium]